MCPFPEEIIEHIMMLLPMAAKVKVRRVCQDWKRISESILNKQTSLAIVSYREDEDRCFTCCFGCHETFISKNNILRSNDMYRLREGGVKRFCPNIKVLLIEDRSYSCNGPEIVHDYRQTLVSLSIPGLSLSRTELFPNLRHVQTVLHDYGGDLMQTSEKIRQSLPLIECISLSHLRFFLCEAVLPHGFKHLSVLGGNSLRALTDSPAGSTLEALDYEEGFKIMNQVDVDFHFPSLKYFWYEDSPGALKMRNIVSCLIRSPALISIRLYISINNPDALLPETMPEVWKLLFRHTPHLKDFLIHSLAYDSTALGFDDEVVKYLVRHCPMLETISIYDKDDTLSDAALDELSKLNNLKSLQIESKNSLFTNQAVTKFLSGNSHSRLRKVRITGQQRREKIYTEHTLVRSYMGGNEWRVCVLKDVDKNKLLTAVICEQLDMDVDQDTLQQQIEYLRTNFRLNECEVSGTID